MAEKPVECEESEQHSYAEVEVEAVVEVASVQPSYAAAVGVVQEMPCLSP